MILRPYVIRNNNNNNKKKPSHLPHALMIDLLSMDNARLIGEDFLW